MIRIILALTLRQLLGQKRTLLLVGLALIPVLIAVIYRFSDAEETPARFAAEVLLNRLVVQALLPLTALVVGTAALGSEIEDGTAVYILAKPIARWRVIAAKLLAAWCATLAVILPTALVAAGIVLAGEGETQIIGAFGVALVLGSLGYTALFVMLSVLTSRALLAGLAYAFIWEGVVTDFAPGVQRFSIREYTLGIADQLADVSRRTFEAELGPAESLILLGVVCIAATWYAIRRLGQFELGEAA